MGFSAFWIDGMRRIEISFIMIEIYFGNRELSDRIMLAALSGSGSNPFKIEKVNNSRGIFLSEE